MYRKLFWVNVFLAHQVVVKPMALCTPFRHRKSFLEDIQNKFLATLEISPSII